jgi:hypothetical protein
LGDIELAMKKSKWSAGSRRGVAPLIVFIEPSRKIGCIADVEFAVLFGKQDIDAEGEQVVHV